MIRGSVLAFLGSLLVAGPAAARGDGSPRRGGEAGFAAHVGAKADRAHLLRRVALVRPAAHGGAASCARRGAAAAAAARCGGGGGGGAVKPLSWRGWSQGLPPALGVQAQGCPAGTMATLAQGHDDVVRCIPL